MVKIENIPNHVAVIPDGNRRWAKAHRLNPWDGHTEGVKKFWEVSDHAYRMGIENLTFWAASFDNLKKRSKIEVTFLLKLLEQELLSPRILSQCMERQTRARVMGEWRVFVKNKNLIESIENLIKKTAHFKERSLNILFAYDGQREMLSALESINNSGERISEQTLLKHMWTGELPPVDLVVRTGGEPHWSAGFLMWLTANSQFYFTEMLWPDFDGGELKKAAIDYDRRERRLGK